MRCSNNFCQGLLPANFPVGALCHICGIPNIVTPPFPLPGILRGRPIAPGMVIPTNASLASIIPKILAAGGLPAGLPSWEMRAVANYCMNPIIPIILAPPPGLDAVAVIRQHILATGFPPLGVNPFDIFVVANISQGTGGGRQPFISAVGGTPLGNPGSASLIWNVGKGDGVFLDILNANGTVKDWNFITSWLAGAVPVVPIILPPNLPPIPLGQVVPMPPNLPANNPLTSSERLFQLINNLRNVINDNT